MPAPSIHTKHWFALKSRIDTIATNPTLTRVEPGQTFPPSDAPFLLISDARNPVQRLGIDTDLHQYTGTLILSARWPLQMPISHAQLVEIGGDIADHFPADLMMQFGGECIRITENATMLQPDRDDAWRYVTVRVLWSSM